MTRPLSACSAPRTGTVVPPLPSAGSTATESTFSDTASERPAGRRGDRERRDGRRRLHERAAGIVAARVVLLFAFRRSVFGALLPLISALVAIGAGLSIVSVLTHAISVASWVPEVAILVALGVGVDYPLFVVSRHRNGLLAGQTPEDAAVTALNSSGRAVLLAGLTVCVALLGLFALQQTTLDGVAVTVTVVVGLTLLPAMLGFLGPNVLRRAERSRLAQHGRQIEQAGGFWLRRAEGLGRRPRIPAVLALAVIAVLAIPFFSMRVGLVDAGTDPSSSTTYQAYQLLAKGFGPGFNGPLEVVGQAASPADRARFAALLTSARSEPGVADVTSPRLSPNGKAEVAEVVPATGSQEAATTTLLDGCGPPSPGRRPAARWRSTSAAPRQPARTTPRCSIASCPSSWRWLSGWPSCCSPSSSAACSSRCWHRS
jgi:putative drug exporter of the RND superfamily